MSAPFEVAAASAAWQLDDDARCAAHRPDLLPLRRARLAASPHAFLRGSAPLFARLLQMAPALLPAPLGEGLIVGDLHLENFGAYRADTLGEDDDKHLVAFDLNDFDAAGPGALRIDLVRLLTSLFLARPELPGAERLALGSALLAAHRAALFDAAEAAAPPPCVTELLARVRERRRDELLAARTEASDDGRRFVRGPRYRDLAPELAGPARASFAEFVRGLGRDPESAPFAIVDLAQRIAGTGSLGCVRIAVLTRGKGGRHGNWIFDLKEQADAARVLAAARVLPAVAPRMVGTATLGTLSLFGRRLAPQEDRLDTARVPARQLDALMRYLGQLVGAAHRRGIDATTPTAPPVATQWDPAPLLDAAAELAGQTLAIYLAYCRRAG